MKDSALWLTRGHSALLLGVSARHFDEAIRPRLAPEAVRGDGKGLRFSAPEVVATWLRIRDERRAPTSSPDMDDALLAAGGDSPNLERLRAARASMAELDLDERRKAVVPLEKLEPALAKFAGVLRGAGTTLQRQYGNEVAAVLNEAVDEVVKAWETMLDDGNRAADGKPDAVGAQAVRRSRKNRAAPVNPRVR